MGVGFGRTNTTVAGLAFFGLARTGLIATRFRLKLNDDADHFTLGPLEPLFPDVTWLVPTHNNIPPKD